MSEHQHIRADGTITFLPHRLNRHPVVVRGLTADELWICCGLCGVAGLLIGAPLSWVFRTIALAPTFVVLGVALGVFVGGGILRRLKRGRSDTWLYRQLQWRIATRQPLMGGGWWSAPRDLHVPPDLRSGSTRKWWEVPPESVYAFTFYVFQQLNRWPTNGEEDYSRNLHALSPYLTPACHAFLRADDDYRRSTGELRQRVRGIYEIPGRGYGDDPAARVRTVSDRDWVVTLDIRADEYYGAEQVKRALVRYPIKVTRIDVDPARNPFGLALDCYDGTPQRISAPEPERPATAPGGLGAQAPQGGTFP